MPLYVYAIIEADGSDGDTFEVLQAMSEPTLTVHPETGQPVRRLLSMPNTPRKSSSSPTAPNMSASNLERLGLSQYTKTSDGSYEKTAGSSGPDSLSPGSGE